MDITYTIMIPILEFFAKGLHSYGWAILGLTVLIRLIVWPLVASSTKSMQRMSQLQPQMKILQERYKDNPEMFQRKMMEFYQKNKANPLGGCLPTLVQLPILFALFATFTGPPFQDKAIPVKVNLLAQSEAAKAHLSQSPTSGATCPYVSAEGKLAKFAVQPGDETAVWAGDRSDKGAVPAKTVDFHVIAVNGEAPPGFKPSWKIGSDNNAATMAPGSGVATFPSPGEVTVEAVLPGADPIDVPIKVDAKDKEEGGFPLFGWMAPQDPFKQKTENSSTKSTVVSDGKTYTVVVTPGESTVIAGRPVQFRLKALEGELPESFKPTWRIAKDPNAAAVDDEGHAVFPRPGEVVVNAMIPGEAQNEPFYFISSIGKVAKGMDLLKPANWDVLGMILLFAITMVMSQKLMVQPPATGIDPEQAAIQKQTQQTMPIAVTAMFFFIPLPAGVYLYMVVSNVIQSLQTWLIMKGPKPKLVDVTEDGTAASGGADVEMIVDDSGVASASAPNTIKLTDGKKSKKKK